MTTDFVRTSSAEFRPIEDPISGKYSSDLQKPRVLEKEAIARVYWQHRNACLHIVTEREIPKAAIRNIEWFRAAWDLGECGLSCDDIAQISRSLVAAILGPQQMPLFQVCRDADKRFSLAPGLSLNVVRHSLARKWWRVPMDRVIRPGEPLEGLRIDVRAPWTHEESPAGNST